MSKSFAQLTAGYAQLQAQYGAANNPLLPTLAAQGQRPAAMVIACCDSRVDPALLLQCEPGDLFVVRNVANIVPRSDHPAARYGVGAALEFGICHLHIPQLIILGHSQCGGMRARVQSQPLGQDDSISNWVALIDLPADAPADVDSCAHEALLASYQNCLTFPWLQERLTRGALAIQLWFFAIETGQLSAYDFTLRTFKALSNGE